MRDWRDELDRDSFTWLPSVLPDATIAHLITGWNEVVKSLTTRDSENSPLLTNASGELYGARNLLTIWPMGIRASLSSIIIDAIRAILGESCGFVRGLLLDKPPGCSWALPWHQDLTIAVREHTDLPEGFAKPTTKAGVPHVEASLNVLERMLTVRIHLDAMDACNGALQVLPGSHRTGKTLRLAEATPTTLTTPAGGILLMRPLLAHASGHADETSDRHRRIIHLEFAADRELPGGLKWANWWDLECEKGM